MDGVNYHHLFYFWSVVREGGVLRAGRKLGVAQPTVTQQVHALEKSLHEKLLERVGRKLVLTKMGQIVYQYANDIFLLGREMEEVIKGRPSGRPLRLVVGVTDDVPKLLAYRLVQSALRVPERVHVTCYEGHPEILVDELVDQTLDVVLTGSLVKPRSKEHVHSSLLGECGVSFFAARSLAARLRPSFPKSLDGAPMLLPTPDMGLRSPIEQWLADLRVCPRFVGEFQDTALLSVFGAHGLGVFPASSAVEADVRTQVRVEVVGRASEIRQSFYAVTVERRLTHPSVALMLATARSELFPRRATLADLFSNERDDEPPSA